MSSEVNNYEAALADCERELGGIDKELAKIEAKRATLQKTRVALRELISLNNPQTTSAGPEFVIPKNAFKDMSIVEATKKYLNIMKVGRSTNQIAAALKEGGYKTESKNFYDTVRSVLKSYKVPKGAFTYKDGLWGLAEWDVSESDMEPDSTEEQED
jgi:hypothetical protein